jgi:DNA primase
MENCSVRDAAVKLSEWFSVGEGSGRENEKAPAKPEATEGREVEAVNKPLTFQLKGIDPSHSYLVGRGVSRELAEKFGVGFFPGRGSMSGRVVIPIHNTKGELVAYAGRAINGSEPKYKLPTGFHKSLELFNLHRAVGEGNPRCLVVIIVEGFFDCMKVTATGFPCVALMGCSMSERQQELLRMHFKAAWLMLDGDEAGRTAAAEIGGRLLRSMWVRQVVVPEGKQPDSMGEDEVRQLLK